MAFESEVYQIDINTTGEAEARQGAAAIEKVEKATDDMTAASVRGRDALGRFTGGMGQMEKAAAQAASSTRSASHGIKDFGSGVAEAGVHLSVNSNKLQVFAQGLDDLQYVPEQGLRPILNNLIQISPALGIAALGAQQLYTHWDDLAGLFGQGATRTEAERMEELGKQTSKTADETARLLKYEEGRKHAAAQGQKPEAATEYGKAIDKAFSEGPLDAVNKGLDKYFGTRIQAMADVAGGEKDRKAREMVAMYEADPRHRSQFYPAYLKARTTLEESYGSAREKFRTETLTDPANRGTLRQLIGAARANPRDFGPGGEKFAESLGAAADPGAAARSKILGAFTTMANKIAEKFPELAEKVQKELQKQVMEKGKLSEAGQAVIDEVDGWLEGLAEAGKAVGDEVDEWLAGFKAEDKAEHRRARQEIEQDLATRATTGTGFNQRAELAAVRGLLAGGSRGQVTMALGRQMFRELRGQGVDAQLAFDMARDRSRQVVGGALEHAMGGGGAAQRIGMGEFARSVESAGMVKMTDLTTQMKDSLAQIVTNTRTIGLGRPLRD